MIDCKHKHVQGLLEALHRSAETDSIVDVEVCNMCVQWCWHHCEYGIQVDGAAFEFGGYETELETGQKRAWCVRLHPAKPHETSPAPSLLN